MGHETEATSVAPPQSWDDGTPPPRRQPRPGYLPYVLRPPALELLSIPQQPPEGRCCPPISPTESSNVHAVLPRAPAYPYACWRAGEDASSGELCSSRVATPPAQASSETQCRERASGRVCGRPFAPAEQGAPTRDGRPVAALEMTPRVPRRFARPAATIAMPPPPPPLRDLNSTESVGPDVGHGSTPPHPTPASRIADSMLCSPSLQDVPQGQPVPEVIQPPPPQPVLPPPTSELSTSPHLDSRLLRALARPPPGAGSPTSEVPLPLALQHGWGWTAAWGERVLRGGRPSVANTLGGLLGPAILPSRRPTRESTSQNLERAGGAMSVLRRAVHSSTSSVPCLLLSQVVEACHRPLPLACPRPRAYPSSH